MTGTPFQIVPLDTAVHDRSRFTCGQVELDRYLREQASQDIHRRVAACFVAVADPMRVVGYYTLSPASVALTGLPDELRRKLPRYASVPAYRMGRLAVEVTFKGQGWGGVLLVDALRRAARTEIPATALIVDAKDEQAVAFYRHHGFMALADSPLTLFLPLAGIGASQRNP